MLGNQQSEKGPGTVGQDPGLGRYDSIRQQFTTAFQRQYSISLYWRVQSLQRREIVLAGDGDVLQALDLRRQCAAEVRRARPRVRDRFAKPAREAPLAVRRRLLLDHRIEDAARSHDSHRLRRRYDLTAL